MSIDEAMKTNVIATIYDVKEEDLKTNDKLKTYWQNTNTKEPGLYEISTMFNEEYYKYRAKLCMTVLEKRIKQYDTLITCISKLNQSFRHKIIREKDVKEKDVLFSFVDSTQFHIDRLQYQCNQLIYRNSFRLAIIVAIISIFFSIGSICFTVYYGRGYLFCPSKNSSETLEKTECCYPKDTPSSFKSQENAVYNSDKITNNQSDTIYSKYNIDSNK